MENEFHPEQSGTEIEPVEDELETQARERIGRVYDAKTTNTERIEVLLIQLKYIETPAIQAQSSENIREAILSCADAPDRDTFIDQALQAIRPLLDYQREHPEEARAATRKAFVEYGGFTPLNELLSYGRREDGETVHIHLAPAEGVEHWRDVVLNGFRELAKQVQTHPEDWETFRTVTATSWIVAKNPGLLERLGFTIEGPISDEVRQQYFAGETRPVARATMNRETLLRLYGS